MNGLAHQRGMGYWGYMLVIVALVVFGRLGMTTVPAYMSNQTLDTIIVSKMKTAGNKSGSEIINEIVKQMRFDLPNMKADETIELVNDVPGNILIKTNYDVRNKLFGHVDIVSHFEKEYPLK